MSVSVCQHLAQSVRWFEPYDDKSMSQDMFFMYTDNVLFVPFCYDKEFITFIHHKHTVAIGCLTNKPAVGPIFYTPWFDTVCLLVKQNVIMIFNHLFNILIYWKQFKKEKNKIYPYYVWAQRNVWNTNKNISDFGKSGNKRNVIIT